VSKGRFETQVVLVVNGKRYRSARYAANALAYGIVDRLLHRNWSAVRRGADHDKYTEAADHLFDKAERRFYKVCMAAGLKR